MVEEGIEDASQWAAKRGWKSIWSAAKPCQQKGPASGGVAILVRDGLGLREADSGAGVYTVTEASTSSLNGEYVAIATAESRYLYCNLKGAVMRSAAGAWRLYRSAGATVPEYTSTTNAPTPPTGHWKSPSNGHCAVRKAEPNYPGRTCHGILEAPGYGELFVTSVYLITGQGMSADNLKMLAAAGARAELAGIPWICAGHFQATPAELAATEYANQASATIVQAATERGTCRNATGGWRTIDFYILQDALARGVAVVEADHSRSPNPHVPVALRFHPRLTSTQALAFRKPAPLPHRAPFGPRPKPPDWTRSMQAAQCALQSSRNGAPHITQQQVDSAYKVFANTAEAEIGGVTDTEIKYPGQRARKPQLHWVPVLRETVVQDRGGPEARKAEQLKWIATHLRDATADCLQGQPGPAGAEAAAELAKEQQWEANAAEVVQSWLKRCRKLVKCRGDIDEADAAALEADEAELEADVLHAVSTAQAESRAGWHQWQTDALEAGAAAAHRYIKEPAAWKPQTTLRTDGTITADPCLLLEKQAEEWHSEWQAAPQEPVPGELLWWASLDSQANKAEALGCVEPDAIRTASKRFRETTATSIDGLHVRHFSLLCDTGLRVLSVLFLAMEASGKIPAQVRALLVILLPKPTGGTRPIDLFPAVMRLWGRCRRSVAEAWESAHDRDYIAAGRDRSATDATWRAAARAESSVGTEEAAATSLFDMVRFFERIRFEWLFERAERHGFDLRILRICLAMYMSPRFISGANRVVKAVSARRGVAAGCIFALTCVRIYILTCADDFVLRHPLVSLDVYVDDWALDATGPEEQVYDALSDAAGDLIHVVVKDELNSEVSRPKAATVASSPTLAKRLRSKLGPFGGAERNVAVRLGIDFAAGRKRAAWKGRSTRAKRLARAQKRVTRASFFTTVAGMRARKLFTAGIKPLAGYGSEVSGMSDSQLDVLTRMEARFLTPRARGRSLTALLLLRASSSLGLAATALVRWAREVWEAATYPRPRGFTLPQCRQRWEASLAAEPESRLTWYSVRGPMGAARLEAARLGWQFTGPFSIQTDKGITLLLTQTSPRLIAQAATAAYERKLEAKLAASWTKPDTTLAPECERAQWTKQARLAAEPIRRFLRSTKHTPNAKATVATAACNGFWPRARLARCRKISELCDKCGTAPDTIHHRLWKCPAVDEERKASSTQALRIAAEVAGEHSLLFNRGWMWHPSDAWPEPADALQARFEQFTTADREDVAVELADAREWSLQGLVHQDGSCSPHILSELARASWAAVQVDERGHPTARVSGVVPRELPQTAPVSEWCAYAAVCELASAPTTGHQDCLAVTKELQKPLVQQLRHSNMHAGMVRETLRYEGTKHIEAVLKVKAHTNIEQVQHDELLLRHHLGNSAADEAAKGALARHPAPHYLVERRVGADLKFVKGVFRVMVALLPLWAKVPKAEINAAEKVPTPFAGPRATADKAAVTAEGAAIHKHLADTLGTALRPSLLRILCRPQQHRLAIAITHGEPVLFCEVCGAWAESTPKKLAAKCKLPRTVSSETALRTIIAGWTPHKAAGASRQVIGRIRSGCLSGVTTPAVGAARAEPFAVVGAEIPGPSGEAVTRPLQA